MDMERRHKNRKVVASGEEPRCVVDDVSVEEPRCVVDDVPDDLLRLILLRLDSPLWLFRAACACKRWRLVVDGGYRGRVFLRLASSLHPPAVVGYYQNNVVGGGRRFVPSSSLPEAPRCFSLDFIPRYRVIGTSQIDQTDNWDVADCHDGLVLLRERSNVLSDLIICNPLTRRYRRIQHPPGRFVGQPRYMANIFLIDGEDGNMSISNFRVLYRSDSDDVNSQLYLFSSPDAGGGGLGNWRLLRRSRLDDRYRDGFGRVAGRVEGVLYLQSGAVTVLDKDKLEFAKVDLPVPSIQRNHHHSTFAVVHGAAAGTDPTLPSAPVVFIVRVHGETLELFRRVHGSGEWVLEHSIAELFDDTRLPGYPDGRRFRWQKVEVIAGGTGFAILSAWLEDRAEQAFQATRTTGVSGTSASMNWLLSFNVDTMELQAVTNETAYCGKMAAMAYTLPWPRFLRASRPLLKPKSIYAIKANPTMCQFPSRVMLQ